MVRRRGILRSAIPIKIGLISWQEGIQMFEISFAPCYGWFLRWHSR